MNHLDTCRFCGRSGECDGFACEDGGPCPECQQRFDDDLMDFELDILGVDERGYTTVDGEACDGNGRIIE